MKAVMRIKWYDFAKTLMSTYIYDIHTLYNQMLQMFVFNRPRRKLPLWWYEYLLYGRYKVWDGITYPFTSLNVRTSNVK